MTNNTNKEMTPVSDWLTKNLEGSSPPYKFELIAAGGSNLTYKITDSAGNDYALRRPPKAGVLASAHDMGREWKIMSSLEKYNKKLAGKTGQVPVPKCLTYCNDPAVLGTDFYVMSFEDGIILRDTKTVENITEAEAKRATESLVEVQIAMHKIDLEAAELSDFAKHEDYIGRQLKRWKKQVDAANVRELPLHDELYKRLEDAKPNETAPAGLVHGDYRFDNCVLSKNWEVSAVLDWELCTLGNPIADFVWSAQYWTDTDDEFCWLVEAPTILPAFISRQEYIEMYFRQSGFDMSDINYYTVFSWWKQSSIVEGVNARLMVGGGGGLEAGARDEDKIKAISKRVDYMLEHSHDLAKGVI